MVGWSLSSCPQARAGIHPGQTVIYTHIITYYQFRVHIPLVQVGWAGPSVPGNNPHRYSLQGGSNPGPPLFCLYCIYYQSMFSFRGILLFLLTFQSLRSLTATRWQPPSWTSTPGWSTSSECWPGTAWEWESPAPCLSGPGQRTQVRKSRQDVVTAADCLWCLTRLEAWTCSLLCSPRRGTRWCGWRRREQIWTGHHLGGNSSVSCWSLIFKTINPLFFTSALAFLPESKPPPLSPAPRSPLPPIFWTNLMLKSVAAPTDQLK